MRTAGFHRACVCALLMFVSTTASAQQVSQSAQGNLQGFSVVLVLGDLQDGATSDNIPPAARAALGDLRDFLPYRSYRVLDTAWILGSTSQLFRGTSRLRGSDEQMYEVNFTSNPINAQTPSLQLRFMLNEAGYPSQTSNEYEHRQAQIRTEMVQMTAARAALEKEMQNPNVSGSPQDRKAYIAETQARMRDIQRAIDAMQAELRGPGGINQTLIDTSFNMRIGETVVVGTSRVRGDKALIALLTAVRK
jgi:hypothetical protein